MSPTGKKVFSLCVCNITRVPLVRRYVREDVRGLLDPCQRPLPPCLVLSLPPPPPPSPCWTWVESSSATRLLLAALQRTAREPCISFLPRPLARGIISAAHLTRSPIGRRVGKKKDILASFAALANCSRSFVLFPPTPSFLARD